MSDSFTLKRDPIVESRALNETTQCVVDYYTRGDRSEAALRVDLVIRDLQDGVLTPQKVNDLADAVAHHLYVSGAPPRERLV